MIGVGACSFSVSSEDADVVEEKAPTGDRFRHLRTRATRNIRTILLLRRQLIDGNDLSQQVLINLVTESNHLLDESPW